MVRDQDAMVAIWEPAATPTAATSSSPRADEPTVTPPSARSLPSGEVAVAQPSAAPADTVTTEVVRTAAEDAKREEDKRLLAGDYGTRLRRASALAGRGETTLAERLYQSVLAERPADTEAITGLGNVYRARGETTSALALYEKALRYNDSYLPALSSAADIKWQGGNRAEAAALYRRLVDRFGETTVYGQRASARLRELEPKPESVPSAVPAVSGAAASTSEPGSVPMPSASGVATDTLEPPEQRR